MIAIGLLAAVACASVLAVAVRRHERAVRSVGDPRPRVVAFELAGCGAAAYRQLADLGERGRSAMRSAIRIDRWIIVGYAGGLAVLSLLSIWIVRETSSGAIETAGTVTAVVMAAAALAAGALDVRENAALVVVLDGWSDTRIPDGTSALDAAAMRQAHRRRLIEAFDGPSAVARQAALLKFGLLGVVALWGVAVGCITVTHYAS